VIGINTAIRADAMGIGFAIPINKAKEIKDQLVAGESIAHPYLGVQIATLTPDIARRNNEDPNAGVLLPEVAGVLVIRVVPNTPAAEAGLRRGDVVLEIDGEAIASADVLQRRVEDSRVGQTLRLKVKRGNRNRATWPCHHRRTCTRVNKVTSRLQLRICRVVSRGRDHGVGLKVFVMCPAIAPRDQSLHFARFVGLTF
jgi:predicted metalloprotease with PDZ domain